MSRPNAVWHNEKCFCSPTDPWVYASNYQTRADFSAKRHPGTEVCMKADALGSSPTWEEEKMQHDLTLNPRHELSSDIMTDIIRFSSLSLPVFSSFICLKSKPHATFINKPTCFKTNRNGKWQTELTKGNFYQTKHSEIIQTKLYKYI